MRLTCFGVSPPSLSLIRPQVIVVEESPQVTCPITTKLVLDEDEETKEPVVQVHRNLVTKLKPHQVDGKSKVLIIHSCKYPCHEQNFGLNV